MLWFGRRTRSMSWRRLWGVAPVVFKVTKEKGVFQPICHKSFGQSITVYLGCMRMDKIELIDCICEINRSAKTEFLAQFSEEDLTAYLEHLMELDLHELAVCS